MFSNLSVREVILAKNVLKIKKTLDALVNDKAVEFNNGCRIFGVLFFTLRLLNKYHQTFQNTITQGPWQKQEDALSESSSSFSSSWRSIHMGYTVLFLCVTQLCWKLVIVIQYTITTLSTDRLPLPGLVIVICLFICLKTDWIISVKSVFILHPPPGVKPLMLLFRQHSLEYSHCFDQLPWLSVSLTTLS